MTNKTNNIEFRTKHIIIYFLLYKAIIEFIYVKNISPIYNYSGLMIEVNKVGFVISIFYLLLVIIVSPKDKSRPSTYFFIILEIFIFIPVLSYYWLNNQSIAYVSYIMLCLVIMSFVLRKRILPINIKFNTATILLNLIFVMYVFSSIYLIIKRGGIDSRALNFDLIYDLRSENNVYGILGYILNWCAKVFCPFYFVYFYNKGNKLCTALVLGIQILLYLSFGNKAFLFSVGFLVMCVSLVKRGKFVKEFCLAITSINIIAYLLDVLNISSSLRRAIPYRTVFIPAQIQFRYYDFFSQTNKMYFADSILGKIFSIKSPYFEPVSYMISRYYSTTGKVANANTGIFADAYANGGLICMIIFTLILAFMFCFIDATTTKLPLFIVVGAFSYLMFVLNDTPLLTSLVTGGMVLMIFLLMLYNSSIKEINESVKKEGYII